jgi:ABC-type multidrug transport system fused ATPase/permease subunit
VVREDRRTPRQSVLTLFAAVGPRLRRRLAILGALILAVSVLELLSTGAMLPLMTALIDENAATKSVLLARLRDMLAADSHLAFVSALAVGFLALVAVRTFAVALGYRYQYRVAYAIQRELARDLLGSYLRGSYRDHLASNPAERLKNVQSEVPALTNGVLVPSMQIVSETFVAVAILILLLAIDPMLTLALAVAMCGAAGAIYGLSRRRTDVLGGRRMHAVSRMFRAASSGLSGFKEIKVLRREATFLAQYDEASAIYAKCNSEIMFLAQLPRVAIELLAFGGLIAIILYGAHSAGDVKSALPIVATYAVAAYRLMPSAARLVAASMQLRYYRRTTELVARALQEAHPLGESAASTAAPLRFEREIALSNVTFSYPGAHRPALEHVSLRIPKSSTVGLVGPSGAGKSTVTDIILGLLDGYDGQLTVDGEPLGAKDLPSWQSRIGFVPQAIYLADDTLRRNVAFGIPDEQIDDAAVDRAVAMSQLADVIACLPDGLNAVIGELGVKLSGGQRQRVGIARALYHDPEILVFDEATSALDGLTEQEVAREIELLAGSKTLIIIAHRLATIQRCEHIYVLDGGRVIDSGRFEELKRGNPYFAKVTALG